MKKLRITVDGKTYDVEVEVLGGKVSSIVPAAAPAVQAAPAAAPAPAPIVPPAAPAAPAPKAPAAPAGAKDIASPLAAVVVSVNVKEGQQVNEGDLVVMLEAMKMNTPVNATCSGTVGKICVSAGQSVEEGQVLISLS
ncbi:MAG: acetyl-CoA carboxylase biotin carboxyl carrier protein subunit [Verrucomicrobia bacterium]|nr:MAG: acetyl-CoA carboxylase biotin carboxyl carrier protein subunit [Verrucomicrobiota bacterium]